MPRGDLTRAAAARLALHGVVTCAALRTGGVSPRLAAREAAANRWVRVAREVYVPHPPPLTRRELVAAARAYVGADCIVTGSLVLAELGRRWVPEVKQVHVLVPEDVHTTSSGAVRVTRTTAFDQIPTWRIAGARMAELPRAVVDAARDAASLRDARGIVLAAVSDGCATAAELRHLLDQTQRNGSGIARRAVLDAERGCASPPEAELVDALLGRGQRFLVNPELRVDGVLLGYPDIWLVDLNVGGEVESSEWHESDEGAESTYDRHERFAAVGVPLVHLGVARLRSDVHAAAGYLLQRALEARRTPPGRLLVVPRGPVLR